VKGCFTVLALLATQFWVPWTNCAFALAAAPVTSSRNSAGEYQAWRVLAAKTLGSRVDANSLATAAALKFAGRAARSRPAAGNPDSSVPALELIARASELAPQSAGIAWLHLALCAQTPACGVRDVATIMRWVDADNGAAWMPTLAAAQKAAETNNLRWAAIARGLGIIYFAILPSDYTEEYRQRVANAATATQEACAKLAGHATIPWCPAEWKSTLQVWGPARPDFPQMQKVKSVFDPQNILSPGRFAPNL